MTPLLDLPDDVRVARLDSTVDGEAWRAAFVGAYQAVWSEPPYDERHSPDEAAAVLRRALEHTDNITLLAYRPSGVVVGFAMAFPVAAKYGVVRDIRGLLPIEHTMYFAELGVVEQWRGKGLAGSSSTSACSSSTAAGTPTWSSAPARCETTPTRCTAPSASRTPASTWKCRRAGPTVRRGRTVASSWR